MAKKTNNIDVVREIALSLQSVEESTLHGAPSFKLHGKLLACPAIHPSAKPDTLAVRLDFDERERLIAAEPDIYYVTEHYLKHPMVLVRLSQADRNSLKNLLSTAHSLMGPKEKPAGSGGK
ncbi:MAG: MmcQ/YjbR family DNA-binding protein [Verrucomicrobiaceae bacterium]|nr:MmcQ/YjbR family DNA-binding protein [Verrucomicrobiaceae bacterium]